MTPTLGTLPRWKGGTPVTTGTTPRTHLLSVGACKSTIESQVPTFRTTSFVGLRGKKHHSLRFISRSSLRNDLTSVSVWCNSVRRFIVCKTRNLKGRVRRRSWWPCSHEGWEKSSEGSSWSKTFGREFWSVSSIRKGHTWTSHFTEDASGTGGALFLGPVRTGTILRVVNRVPTVLPFVSLLQTTNFFTDLYTIVNRVFSLINLYGTVEVIWYYSNTCPRQK